MISLLSLLDNAIGQGLLIGIGALGVGIALRVLRYADLTADGSFMLGAIVYAKCALSGLHWSVSVFASIGTGALAGALTASLHLGARVNRLLSGILTSMIAYSLSFRILGGRPNVGLGGQATPFTVAEQFDSASRWPGMGLHPSTILVELLIAAAICAAVVYLLRSEWGLVLRGTGFNERLIGRLGRRPVLYQLAGLSIANALVATAGALVAARQGFADINMGVGSIVTFIAALVLGEELLRRLSRSALTSPRNRVLAPMAGCLVYYFVSLAILRASIAGWLPVTIRPTDLKLFSALLIIAVVFYRSRRALDREEALAL